MKARSMFPVPAAIALAIGACSSVAGAGAMLSPADPPPSLADKLGVGQATVRYFSHSGVAVRTASTLLIFDYIRSTARSGGDRVDFLDVDELPAMDVVVFVTHAHRDHYDPVVLDWADRVPKLRYVVSDEVTESSRFKAAQPSPSRVTAVAPDEELTILGGRMEVRTVRSNDQGVALWVSVDGVDVLHTGDHALWGWKEDTFEANRDAYLRELRKFTRVGRRPDIAFLCSDLRMPERSYLSGAPRAIELLDPALAVAIHNYGRHAEAAKALHQALPEGSRTVVARVAEHGSVFRYPAREAPPPPAR